MDRLFRKLSGLCTSPDFRKFQNGLSKSIYDTLGQCYSNSDGEIKMVTDMCGAVNGREYDGFFFHAKKIHGSRSYVEFSNGDKPVTKELADMAIISVVTENRQIIFEKTAFVQNKKEDTSLNWRIDQDQLFLLQNFPTFRGNRGIFKKNYSDEIAFLNHSGCLGNYGLFSKPGEMVLANAKTIYKLQQGDCISLGGIKGFPESGNNWGDGHNFPLGDLLFFADMEKWHMKKYRLPFADLPFMNNSRASHNIYKFVRNWTYFNIGETSSALGSLHDNDLSTFTRTLLRQVGLSNTINLQTEQEEHDTNMAVFVAHLTLDKQ